MIQELKARIERYVADGKNRTLNSVAVKAGVSYTTLTRITSGKGNGVELSNVLAILRVVSNQQECSAFLSEYFPHVGSYLLSMAKASPNPADWTTNVGSELEQALYDYENFCIISLASTPKGTSRPEILTAIGRCGEAKLAALIENEVLQEVEGRIVTAQRHFTPTNNAVLCAEIGHMLNLIRPTNIGKQRQHCAVRTNGVSLDGQRRLHACIQNALLEADKILADSPGEIPVFVGAVMGMFLPAGDEK